MKHSGLQKSISSIFDGAEPLKQEPAPTALPQTPVDTAPAKQQPAQPTLYTPAVSSNTPASTATATPPKPPSNPAVCAAGTVVPINKPIIRPRPVPRKSTVSQKTFSFATFWATLKSRLAGGSKSSLDPRQKKILILGGILTVVLIVVIMFVLGSGPSGAKAASKKNAKEASVTTSNSSNLENWVKPEIYPLSLRDPMNPSSNTNISNDQSAGQMTVRGIVYSSIKPSAIIANQIVFEGDVILGVKIIKIGKDFVAFEKDGKRWQQQVRQ